METVVGETVELDVTINTVTFHAPDTGYTVARATPAGSDQITVVGVMIDPHPGITVRVSGTWDTHPRYGTQLKVTGYSTVTPKDAAAIEAFLASGIIAGIGVATATDIVARFGADTLDIMAGNPDLLLKIPGIGKKTLAKITDSYGKHKGIQDLMLVLAKAGIAPGLAGKIWKHFDDKAAWVVQKAPYRLTDVAGIGFSTADAVAKKLGIDPRDPERVKSGMLHVLDSATGDGHCYLPMSQTINDTVALLGVTTDLVVDAYTVLANDKKIIDDGERSWLAMMFNAETAVAHHLGRLGRGWSKRLATFGKWDATQWEAKLADAGLAAAQSDAVRAALTNRVSVLTGGPGCGKTYTVNTIVQLAADAGASIGLAAPTGRAAKRMAEQCSREASTIHRMLGLQGGDDDTGDQPLDGDLFVIDESSMLDIHLANKLLKAIPDGAHVVFVGDEDQLPSVGPGKFLSDLIASDTVPVTRLTQVFRQAAASGIVQVAHAVNHGTLKRDVFTGFDDIYWWPCDQVDTRIIDMVTERIPKKFGIATADVQVLAPMKKGVEGVDALNTRLQETLNPARPHRDEHALGDRIFRIGDRVMQTRNNYDKNIFNGTPGLIDAIGDNSDGGKKITIITDDGDAVDYEPSELSQLMHAYAITIHKSQGSEYPAVVIPVTTAAWIMWRRNLLYTAITRARQLVVLLGDPRALDQAVRKLDTSKRHTSLAERLETA